LGGGGSEARPVTGGKPWMAPLKLPLTVFNAY